jgi:hypothetical protein
MRRAVSSVVVSTLRMARRSTGGAMTDVHDGDKTTMV